MRKLSSYALLFSVVALTGTGCAQQMVNLSAADSERASKIDSSIAKARQAGAEKCAPVELARTEVANEYFKHEAMEPFEEKSTIDMYFSKASNAAAILMDKVAKDCAPAPAPAPAPVVKAEPPPPAPAPAPKVEAPPAHAPMAVPAPAPAKPLDTDGDGVTDDKDQCPTTPKGEKVNAVGCPLDTDGDGVTDDKDQCPTTPKGEKVNAVGCPLDTDGDGVTDDKDKCPTTPKGRQVDRDGCYISKINIKLAIEFDTAKHDIRDQYDAQIAKVAGYFKQYPNATMTIEGHTDNVGDSAMNKTLSENRAAEVKNALVKQHGIDPARISTAGFGEDRPVADNATAEGRQKNRRIEATIMGEMKE